MTLGQWSRNRFTIGGRSIQSASTAFPGHRPTDVIELLRVLLLAHPNDGLSYATIAEQIWPDPDRMPDLWLDSIRHAVCWLRSRGVVIQNERGIGYRIAAEDRATSRRIDRIIIAPRPARPARYRESIDVHRPPRARHVRRLVGHYKHKSPT